MPRRASPIVLVAALLSTSIGACTPQPVTIVLAKIGAACTTNDDCGSALCNDGLCTAACASQDDCPVGFDCGLHKASEAAPGGIGPTCYAPTYTADVKSYGADCGLVAADPKSGAACDPTAANPCAQGFACRSAAQCDPLAYCTTDCDSDLDCPPTFFCGPDTGPICTTDGDCQAPMTCQAVPGGTVKVCMTHSRCLERVACSDCATDDQCGSGSVCATGKDGARFCASVCRDTVTSFDCPQPATSSETMDNIGSPFITCVPSAPGSKVNVCAPVGGTCHGPSNAPPTLPGLAGQQNTLCSWCRLGVPSDCGDGVCYEYPFTHERLCTYSCSLKWTRSGNNFTPGPDSCPAHTYCNAGPTETCTTTCVTQGFCDPDENADDAGNLTCYPSPASM